MTIAPPGCREEVSSSNVVIFQIFSRLFNERKWTYSFFRFYQNVDNLVNQNVEISILSKCRQFNKNEKRLIYAFLSKIFYIL